MLIGRGRRRGAALDAARLMTSWLGHAAAVLVRSGLVGSTKVGRVRTYSIQPDALGPAERWIRERRTGWERRLDRLGDHLAELGEEPRR